MGEKVPLVCGIRHFALDDGPGIRSTVFFKGCPLSCAWCHNPESMDPGREISFRAGLCIGCGECGRACSRGAIRMDSGERIARDLCDGCGACAEACPATALKVVGIAYTSAGLVEILLKDRVFYETSGGGVTLSGGEPTLSMDFAAEVAKQLKEKGIHVALQTAGIFDFREFREKLLPHVDLIYYDIKILEPRKHETWTGRSNRRIMDNFVELSGSGGIPVIPRIPLVPGITATTENLRRIAEFLRRNGASRYELLPYNSGGIAKRLTLGKDVPAALKSIRWNGKTEDRSRRTFAGTFFRARS